MSPRTGVPPAPPAFTVAEVLRVGLPDYTREHRLPPQHWRVVRAIMACRTPELGGHLYQCSRCGKQQFVPHSCRNRHCPTCQGANGYAWMQAQADSLLPIPYFHVVFTLPHILNPLIRQNQQACYDLLFAAASATLLEFGRHELQAQIGITLVLHTWSQTLGEHSMVTPSSPAADCATTALGPARRRIGSFRCSHSRPCSVASFAPGSSNFIRTEN